MWLSLLIPLASAVDGATTATIGPFEIACTAPSCTVSHDGEMVLPEAWSYDAPGELLRPLGLLGMEDTWLVQETAGDGCPVMYRLMCADEGQVRVTELFGNCNALTGVQQIRDALRITLPAGGGITDRRRKAVFEVDRPTCEASER